MLPVLAVAFVLVTSSASGNIPGCENVDVGSMHVLMDISGSTAIPADTLRTFAENLMEEFGSGKGRVLRVFSTFSDSVNVLFRDDDPAANPQGALNGLVKDGLYTDTAGALDYIKDNFITGSTGCSVIVIVTDGESRDHVATAAAAADLRNNYNNVSFCVVPVGRPSCQGLSELNDLAGDNNNVLERLVDPDVTAAAVASCICDKCPAEEQTTTSEADCTLFVGEYEKGYGGYIVDSTGAATLLNESITTFVSIPQAVYMAACDGQDMFYTDYGLRHFDGTNDKELAAFVGEALQSIALDTKEKRVFVWSQKSTSTPIRQSGRLFSVDYQGLNQAVVASDTSNVASYGMAVDEDAKFIYYTLLDGPISPDGVRMGSLWRVSYAAPSTPEPLAIDLNEPMGLFFDAISGILYMILEDATIYTMDTRTPFSPTPTVAITEPTNGQRGWSLVLCGGNLYYTDFDLYAIWRIPVTATNGDQAVQHTTTDMIGESSYALCIY